MSEWWNDFGSSRVKALLRGASRFVEKEAAIDALIAGGGGVIHQETVQINNAQTKLLPSTLFQVVAAQGANRVILPVYPPGWVIAVQSVAYGNLNANAHFELFSGNDYSVFRTVNSEAQTMLTFGADSVLPLRPQVDTSGIVDAASAYANLPLSFTVDNGGTGNLNLGDDANSLTVCVLYSVLDLSTGTFV